MFELPRKIIHVDMDAFYASVEQRDRPELRGLPVVVSGPPQSRSVVCTASYEARRYGIHSAMPASQAYRLCPQAIFVAPRFDVYSAISKQIRGIFHQYTDLVEPLALDEAYLDVTNNKMNEPSATRLAMRIKEQIVAETGLSCSAGVSFNKFLAKLASGWKKPSGLTVITPEQAPAFVAQLPIGKFYGVGKATLKKMLECGIKTGADLKSFGREKLHERFGKMGDFFYELASCRDEREVNPSRERKSIGREITLEQDLTDLTDLKRVLQEVCNDVVETLERHHVKGRTVTLKVRYSDFKTITRSKSFSEAIASSQELYNVAVGLLAATEAGQRPLRLIGASVSNFVTSS